MLTIKARKLAVKDKTDIRVEIVAETSRSEQCLEEFEIPDSVS
jgi:hypothetical protein